MVALSFIPGITQVLLVMLTVIMFGCGPGPKPESVVAYEQFLGHLYSGNAKALLNAVTPETRRVLRDASGLASDTSLADALSIALGWQFERVSGRQPKVDQSESNSAKHVLDASLAGEDWRMVMLRTADGWKLDLSQSTPLRDRARKVSPK